MIFINFIKTEKVFSLISGSFVQRQIVVSKSTSKSSSENLSNHNKHKPTFTNTFVFKTKHESKCQNELFF